MAAQVNQQKQFEEINRAAMFSRMQAQARPSVQQMGMVSVLQCVINYIYFINLLFQQKLRKKIRIRKFTFYFYV